MAPQATHISVVLQTWYGVRTAPSAVWEEGRFIADRILRGLLKQFESHKHLAGVLR